MIQHKAMYCPICKQENSCMVSDAHHCWCMTVQIPKSLLNTLPNSQNASCICQNCIENYTKRNTSDKK